MITPHPHPLPQGETANSCLISAPGKIVLAGEYAVLHGYPALVAAIDKRATLQFQSGEKITVSRGNFGPVEVVTSNADISILGADQLSFGIILGIFNEARRQGLLLPRGNYQFCSDALHLEGQSHQKLGLGSSSAIAATLGAFLLSANQKEAGPKEIFDFVKASFASRGELGSGIDIAASCFGGVLKYRVSKSDTRIDPVQAPYPNENILCVFTGVSQSTHAFLAALRDYARQDKTGFEKAMRELAIASNEMQEAIFSKPSQIAAILDAVDHSFHSLEALGERFGLPIISQAHRDIAKLAKQFGARAKPSGAGGGDIALCFGSPENLAQLRAALGLRGFLPLELDVSRAGVVISSV